MGNNLFVCPSEIRSNNQRSEHRSLIFGRQDLVLLPTLVPASCVQAASGVCAGLPIVNLGTGWWIGPAKLITEIDQSYKPSVRLQHSEVGTSY